MGHLADRLTDYLVLGLYCAVIYVMARPSSSAAPAIKGWFDGMTSLAALATDF